MKNNLPKARDDVKKEVKDAGGVEWNERINEKTSIK